VFIIKEWKRIPKSKAEESTYSREFWMFLGALLLSLSALHIISVTSIKVINKITGFINDIFHTTLPDNLSAPADAIAAYHQLQIPFSIVIIAITAYAQHLKYIKSDKKVFLKKVGILSIISIVIALPICLYSDFSDARLFILILTSVFGIVGNSDIIFGFFKKGKILPSGPAIAHIGMALILIGATLSNGLKEVISINTEGFQVFNNTEDKKEQRENKILYKKFIFNKR
jgi:cytochrome c-type biogenesis protein CcmF